ncbi:MAG: transglycosylase domain-containing protein [Spirochaetia bacterium]|nr:transglycosylase domain-containing protein [Spirochaetia bacterium]
MRIAPPGIFHIPFFAGAALALAFAFCLPGALFDAPYSPVLYDRNGVLLGARVARDGQWRFAPGDAVNPKFAAAITEYEDRRFQSHIGVDPLAVCRAALQNLRSRRIVSGGSTITMQTVRLMRDRRQRTFFEKAVEAVLAIRLEMGRSKEEVLALYAANAPFGANVVGLEAAAWRWYGHPARDLSWAQAATLAVLPNSPALVHPGRGRDTLREKRDALLARLARRGYFDDETLALARVEPLPGEPRPLPMLAPHLLDRIILEEAASGRAGSLSRHDVTLEAGLQARVSVVLGRRSRVFAEAGIMNAACLLLDTQSGEVLAYVGNAASAEAADVDIITSPRSSGSLLKPFLHAAMLDSGQLMPQGLVSDIPTRVGSYSPENNTQSYTGAIPADQALARSLNVPAVRALRNFGVGRFARLLRLLGLSTLFRSGEDYGLPLILGGAEVTLWDIAGLYAGLARSALDFPKGGNSFFPPRYFPAREGGPSPPDAGGGRIFPPQNLRPAQAQAARLAGSGPRGTAEEARPVSAGAAWLTLDALTHVARPGEEAAWQSFASSRKIAWKTGTSFGYRDAWAVGVTSRWTLAVWVGNASGEGRAELRGSNTAAPLLFEVFSFLEPSEWFPKPYSALRAAPVCALSGFPPGPYCASVKYSDIPAEAPHHAACPFCVQVTLNEKQNRRLVLSGGEKEKTVTRGWFVLPPAQEWFYRKWNLDYKALPPSAGSIGSSPPIALFTPEEASFVYVPIEIDGAPGSLVLTAAHRDPEALIHWHLDESYLGSTSVYHEIETRPAPGPHFLTLVDAQGNTLRRRFTVLAED